MKRQLSLLTILVFGAALTALSAGGPSGCGDSTGTGGGGTTVSAADQAAAAGLISAFSATSDSATALTVAGAALKSQTVSCPFGGTYTVSGSTIAYSDCGVILGLIINGPVDVSASGDVVTLTFNDTTYTFEACGDYVFNGTLVADGAANTVVIDATAVHEGETTNVEADVQVESDETLSGTFVFSGGVDVSCEFDHTDVDVCPNTAEACDLDPDLLCDGDDYAADACEAVES